MRRFHVHVKVEDLAEARGFYTAMFGQEALVSKPDYLKWILEDPPLTFAVSLATTGRSGIDHLGFQEPSDRSLAAQKTRLDAARVATIDEKGANCCYSTSDKHWAQDPGGVVWEVYRSMGAIATYGVGLRPDLVEFAPMAGQTAIHDES